MRDSPITTAGTITIDLSNTGVTAGTYALANVVVDAKGRITAVSSGNVPPTGVTSVAIENGQGTIGSGGPITSSGTLKVDLTNTGVTAGSYDFATVVVDAQGRVTSISTGNPLPNVGTSGTYTKVTTDAKGRVIVGAQISNTDVSNALGYVPAPITGGGYLPLAGGTMLANAFATFQAPVQTGKGVYADANSGTTGIRFTSNTVSNAPTAQISFGNGWDGNGVNGWRKHAKHYEYC